MSVISSAIFPEHLLTQLQQSADAAVRKLKSFIYLHRNSSWYVNGSGNYAVRAHISSVKDQGVNVFLTVRTGCHRAEYVFHRLPVSFPEGITGRRNAYRHACRQAQHLAHLRYRFLSGGHSHD
ncbi:MULTISPECIES: hypothetical protein [Enterobacterales]|uniref:hypothetical protein n=1 Tax=Enterobacterales TaxID=91347 RepID=UPI000449E24A|nr:MULTISPECIES: hypothetical protein [Enterobacterales]EFH8165170.1 hypothetical protein [Escherichia coli]EKO7326498.1 hypothetical protein [Salmonella enterica]EMA3679247.1 hypothetical protein [Citrobacter freundii]MBU5512718.1 hypothetical protein [Enterobacteriaceae bacterium S18_ASV_15]MBU5541764.1 hypothetical protein [Pluralibacter sp. S10_ASV_43]MBU5631782.1 hypothetical protein [Enterobacteriaceae bacterium S29_ASV_15]MBU5649728.1 hypothetical protein [Enterobacteriaceae bacterium